MSARRPKRSRRLKKPAVIRGEGKFELGLRKVPDPFNPGSFVEVAANVRENGIAHMASRGRIDATQREAADRYRELYERSQVSHIAAFDPAKEPVDGGRVIDVPITDAMIDARKLLLAADEAIGRLGAELLRAIFSGATIASLATAYQRTTARAAEAYIAGRIVEALDDLVRHWRMTAKGPERGRINGERDLAITGPAREWQPGPHGDLVPRRRRAAQ